MTLRALLVGIALCWSGSSHAATCVEIADGHPEAQVSLTGKCGELKVVVLRRDEPSQNIHLYASFAIFDRPRNEGERVYNEWVIKRSAQMNFSGPVDASWGKVEETMVGDLYLSQKFLL